MSIKNLDKIFEPKSIAVIGASEKEGSIGYSLISNIIDGGYKGEIFPVNPKYKHVQNLRVYRSVKDIGQEIDLAIISIPIANVPSIIMECARLEVGGAIIISAGGKETGKKGEALEAQIKEEAGKGIFRMIGPNCMGLISTGASLNASFTNSKPKKGNLAFISQSGAVGSAILDLSHQKGIGFKYFVSIGSMLDVDFGDLINYMGNDSHVDSIVLYVESLTNIRKFMSAARAISRVKPIIVLKAGRSKAGSQAVWSHTGSIASGDRIYDAAFERAGIVRVDTIEDLFDCSELISKQSIPYDSSLAIITNGGGMGALVADVLSVHGLEPVMLRDETIKQLSKILPSFWQKGNPIDILDDASPKRWQETLDVCLAVKEIKGLVIIFTPQKSADASMVAKIIVDVLEKHPNPPPVYTVLMGGKMVEEGRRILNKAGIPNYETPERAVSAFMYMRSYARNMEMMLEIPPKFEKTLLHDQSGVKSIIRKALNKNHAILTEKESKSLLAAYGISVNRTEIAKSPEEAIFLVKEIGYPVLMKIHSRDMLPETEVHRIQLNQGEEKDIRNSFLDIMKRAKAYNPDATLSGVTIQPVLRYPKFELMMGSKTDDHFGPVILFGMGGTMTEVFKDQAIALPPLNRLLARRLMESTRVYQMLKKEIGVSFKNLDFIEEILVRFSQLIVDFSEIKEIDINPIMIIGNHAYAVDASVIIKPSSQPSTQRLVISPYPNQYEEFVSTKGGIDLFIRPIRPEDAPLLVALFNSMSKKSVYNRFFMHLKSLTQKMIVSLTQIDYDNDMALVAFDRMGKEIKIVGIARFMNKPGETEPGFAVTVGDPWQGKGIGRALMKSLLAIAKE
ncbi:MAG: bifunctional acetate--CoA ligase family protein/GNAT family N-acetyltransferase, partial [Deltaproteobacteria bacterium]|nr:bifunctional acetate--CoA ligase family protein/GNAT family N-acetyltransferase [Deltaproteobacteria bacterium]